MSVGNVNNSNNNAGLYAAGAAMVGAGAGVTAGYLTKPFLKDGAPTDAFVKKINDNIKEILPDEVRQVAEEVEVYGKELLNFVDNAKSVDEIKNGFLNRTMNNLKSVDLEVFKDTQLDVAEFFQQCGIETSPDAIIKLQNASNLDDIRVVVSESLDKQFAGKTLEEVKSTIKLESLEADRKVTKSLFEQFWDSGKKAFVDCEEGAGQAVKKAARSIQGKYAAIYGAIGAGILGLGTLLLCCGKKDAEQPVEAVDTQA